MESLECTCLCCQVHGEETRSLSVCRGCSLICFFNLALMIGMIYCQHSPAVRYLRNNTVYMYFACYTNACFEVLVAAF